MPVVHIRRKEIKSGFPGECESLCGHDGAGFYTMLHQSDWKFRLPTCKICILLHFSDSSNTARVYESIEI